MTGQQLYELYARKVDEILLAGMDGWEVRGSDEMRIFDELAEAIALEFDPSADRAQLLDRAESAECVIRQVARDTYGEDLKVKEFADRAGYDS